MAFAFSENSRMKIREIASVMKTSPQRVKYWMNSIESESVVRNPFCVFDYSYFGSILFRVYFKGAYVGEKDKELLMKTLMENSSVVSVYEFSGEFDLVVEMLCPNASRFNKVLKSLSNSLPSLRHHKIVLNMVTHMYPRFYLTDKDMLKLHMPQEIVIGGDRGVESFTKSELAVMSALLENPRLRLSSLAEKSGMNVKTAKSVVKNLSERKIIRGFKHVIDIDKLGVSRFRLFLKMHGVSQERDDQILDYLLKHPNIVQMHRTVGDWDMEIDIESLDKTSARKLVADLREKFSDVIENFSIAEFYHYYKRSYLPKYIFTEAGIGALASGK